MAPHFEVPSISLIWIHLAGDLMLFWLALNSFIFMLLPVHHIHFILWFNFMFVIVFLFFANYLLIHSFMDGWMEENKMLNLIYIWSFSTFGERVAELQPG